jgi:hypothetical protein
MQMINSNLQSLLQKEVSRREFLGILGLAAVSILGMGHILKLVTGKSLDNHKALQGGGYSSVYGGGKDT